MGRQSKHTDKIIAENERLHGELNELLDDAESNPNEDKEFFMTNAKKEESSKDMEKSSDKWRQCMDAMKKAFNKTAILSD